MTFRVFISYSHADDALVDRLHKHLTQLQREGSIVSWFDREIGIGSRIDDEINKELLASSIFLACVSPDFIASNYCYDTELETALEREAAGDLIIVPIILEPCDWLSTPLEKFKGSPKDGKAVSEYTNENAAFLNVVTDIRKLILNKTRPSTTNASSNPTPVSQNPIGAASRYRVKRDFDALDKRDFVETSFKEIYRFFQDSVTEIHEIPEIETRLTELESDHFSCTIINRGLKRGFETIHVRTGGLLGEISILFGDENQLGTSNGSFMVAEGEYQLYFNSLFSFGSSNEKKMSSHDVAQILWDDLLARVGIEIA